MATDKIDLNNLDKSDWKTYRFDEIAINISERVDPNNTDLEVYVGLEHIDSESLHIKRFGTPDDVNGQKLKFYKGDIIFGRRRAYQRKAGVAPCDGFCSAHALVLRANPDVISPELFPFFLHSDLFMDRAVDISVGSLSPTINWKNLKEQPFCIPSLGEQSKIAQLLQRGHKNSESLSVLKEGLVTSFETKRKHYIQHGLGLLSGNRKKVKFGYVYENWPVQKLRSFASFQGGGAFKSKNFKSTGEHQVLRIGNITNLGFDYDKSPVYLDEIQSSERKYLIPKDAVVLSLTGTNGKRDYGFPTLMDEDKVYLLNQRLVMIVVDKKVMLPKFLYLLAQMEIFKAWFFLNAVGSANQANVSIEDVSEIPLPTPPIEEQYEIIKKLGLISTSVDLVTTKINSSKVIQKSLINQVF